MLDQLSGSIAVTASTTRRDAGLARGIGTWGMAANCVNYTVGAGVFVVPAVVAGFAGAWGPVAILAAAIGQAAITWCFAEAASRVPSSGGSYGFVEAAFGRYWGFLSGVFLYCANVVAAGAIAAAATDQLAALFPVIAAPVARAALILGWFAFLAFVNLRGAAVAARLVEFATLIKLAPLILFLGVGAMLVVPANLPVPAPPVPHDFGRALLLAVFWFAGVHGAVTVGGEVRDPARTLPRAVILGMTTVTLIFLGAQLVAQGALGPALAGSATPLADVMGRVSPALRLMMLIAAAISMTGWLASDALNTPRLIFAFARDGWLPAWLGGLNARSHAPVRAVFVHLTIAAALALGGTYKRLAIVSSLLLVALFIASCLAAARLRARDVARAGVPARLPGLMLAVVVGVGTMAWAGTQATRPEALALVGLAGAASLWFVLARRTA